MKNIGRRRFGKLVLGGSLGMAGSALVPQWAQAQAGLKELVIAEPLHGIGYLPMYVSVANGYFAQEKIAIKILTIESGSGHTNAVLTKQAFAFIGGPEHNAFAKAKGAELRAVVNVVNRGNVYLVAQKGASPKNRDFAGYMKGKRIATEVVQLTRRWLASHGVTAHVEFSWGATEVKVPDLVDAIVDVTERKTTEDEAAYLAYFDPLTGLANRRMLNSRINLALAQSNLEVFAEPAAMEAAQASFGNQVVLQSRDQRLLRLVGRKNRRRHRGRASLARIFKAQEALVLQVEIEQQGVAHIQRADLSRALGRKTQHRVRAVSMVVDQVLCHAQGTG